MVLIVGNHRNTILVTKRLQNTKPFGLIPVIGIKRCNPATSRRGNTSVQGTRLPTVLCQSHDTDTWISRREPLGDGKGIVPGAVFDNNDLEILLSLLLDRDNRSRQSVSSLIRWYYHRKLG